MTIEELRKILLSLPKYGNAKNINPAPASNEAFPGTFNLSFTEPEMYEQYNKQYLVFDKDLLYSKIQPVIRHEDWHLIAEKSDKMWQYLGVFDLSDIAGAAVLVDGDKKEEALEFNIKTFVEFINKIGLDLGKIKIKYLESDTVKNITEGRYQFEKGVARPDLIIKLWQKYGISDAQFIPDKTRDSFLALNIYGLPSPWGYRNEIFYPVEDTLLDIGTLEWLIYEPVFENNQIVDYRDWKHNLSITGVGVERVLMAVNNTLNMSDCNHIEPLFAYAKQNLPSCSEEDAWIFTEAIRVVHRIISDGGLYSDLSRGKKIRIRSFYRSIKVTLDRYPAKDKILLVRTALQLNAENQSYYPELSRSVDATAEEIDNALKRLEN